MPIKYAAIFHVRTAGSKRAEFPFHLVLKMGINVLNTIAFNSALLPIAYGRDMRA